MKGSVVDDTISESHDNLGECAPAETCEPVVSSSPSVVWTFTKLIHGDRMCQSSYKTWKEQVKKRPRIMTVRTTAMLLPLRRLKFRYASNCTKGGTPSAHTND